MPSTKNPCKPTACSCKIEQLINVACEPNESRRILVYDCKKGKVVTLPFSTLAFDCASLLECPTIITILEDIAALTARVTQLEADVTAIEGDLVVIQGDITAIQGDITDIQGDITTLFGDIAAIEGDIAAIELRLDAIEADIVDLQALAHAQNTDTGTTSTTWIVGSGSNPLTIGKSMLTAPRAIDAPDTSGTLVVESASSTFGLPAITTCLILGYSIGGIDTSIGGFAPTTLLTPYVPAGASTFSIRVVRISNQVILVLAGRFDFELTSAFASATMDRLVFRLTLNPAVYAALGTLPPATEFSALISAQITLGGAGTEPYTGYLESSAAVVNVSANQLEIRIGCTEDITTPGTRTAFFSGNVVFLV